MSETHMICISCKITVVTMNYFCNLLHYSKSKWCSLRITQHRNMQEQYKIVFDYIKHAFVGVVNEQFNTSRPV